ncbi:phage tail protein [Nostoc sp. FACHB-152]|uniref:phage baseplate assembly protein V n=1 Tax=unclassified Nostoc TaxID=2593658 RepID=UPI001686B450|nr:MULTISPECIES: phage baseplate assembly protein V [unclassified Nostoc]MBD2449052.1 phage tail protein [Nostoc sp. FACHB-152]MBD2471044.1 phage tail protein [Nostoc sp. FACHB-145]
MNGINLLMPNGRDHHFYGVTVGVVTNNQDPENLGRVKVKFPWLSAEDESDWARVLTPMAGNDRGIYFLPEVDDEVLVAFEQGDINFPYILGALWNGKDKPPVQNEDGSNNQRVIKSRSGHLIILDDTEKGEKIIIQDTTGNNKIEFDSSTNTINIQADKNIIIKNQEETFLKIMNGDILIECKNFSIKTQQNYQLEAGANCKIKAQAKYELEAQSGLGIKCAAGVKVNDGSLEVM